MTLNLHCLFSLRYNGVQLDFKFHPKLQLDFYVIFWNPPRLIFSMLQPLFYLFYFYFERKKVNLGNNPKIDHDNSIDPNKINEL